MRMKEKWKQYLLNKQGLGCAMLENVVIFVVLNVFFKACLKTDDYYMAQICYGAFSGNYDIHLVYCNIILGYIIRFLLLLSPSVSWYTILQVVPSYIALSTITFLWKKKYQGKANFLFYPVLLLLSYELYIKITFTKTAGVLIVCGLLILHYALKCCRKFSVLVLGVGFVSFGYLYRNGVFDSILPFFVVICVIDCILHIKESRKIKAFIHEIVALGMVVVLLLSACNCLQDINDTIYYRDEEWSDFRQYDGLRSKLVDQTINNYNQYKEEYEDINCSENDLKMLYSSNLNYKGLWTSQWYTDIVSIAKKSTIEKSINSFFNIEYICDFIHQWLLVYIKYGKFVLLLLVQVLILCQKKRTNLYYILLLDGGLLAENWYLKVAMNRTFQPHVDFCIIMAVQLFTLFSCDISSDKIESKSKWIVGLLFVFIINNSYLELSQDKILSYMDSKNVCNASESKGLLDECIQDKQHLYIFPSQEAIYSLWQYDAYEVIPKGIYSNFYSPHLYRWPSERKPLEKYGSDNPLIDIVDNENIRLLVSDELESTIVPMYELYCKEHVNENSIFVKVDENKTINIYECKTSVQE